MRCAFCFDSALNMAQNPPALAATVREIVYAGNSGNLLPSNKLKGASNYTTWCFMMKNLLVPDGLWKCVLGTDVDEDRNERAMCKINLNISNSCFPYVMPCTTAKQSWDALAAAFQNKGAGRKYRLQRSLFKIKLSDFESIEAYVSHVLSVKQTLSDIGKVMDDDLLANILLGGLPDSFEPMIMTLESLEDTLTSASVIKKLLSFHGGSETSSASVKPESALYAKGRSNRSNVVCFYCKKTGHIKLHCPSLKKKSENKKPVFTEKNYSQAQRAHIAQDRGTVASTSSVLDGEREVNLLTAALLTKDILSTPG